MFSCISWLRKTYGHFLKNSIAIFLFTFRSDTDFRAVGGLLGPGPGLSSALTSAVVFCVAFILLYLFVTASARPQRKFEFFVLCAGNHRSSKFTQDFWYVFGISLTHLSTAVK